MRAKRRVAICVCVSIVREATVSMGSDLWPPSIARHRRRPWAAVCGARPFARRRLWAVLCGTRPWRARCRSADNGCRALAAGA